MILNPIKLTIKIDHCILQSSGKLHKELPQGRWLVPASLTARSSNTCTSCVISCYLVTKKEKVLAQLPLALHDLSTQSQSEEWKRGYTQQDLAQPPWLLCLTWKGRSGLQVLPFAGHDGQGIGRKAFEKGSRRLAERARPLLMCTA